MSDDVSKKLEDLAVPPISEFDQTRPVAWFIPREIKKKKTKNGKNFWVLKVIDSNSEISTIRCWAVKPNVDFILLNRPYMARLKYDPNWGFSTFSISKNFKLLS
jgi:hypothetical protein